MKNNLKEILINFVPNPNSPLNESEQYRQYHEWHQAQLAAEALGIQIFWILLIIAVIGFTLLVFWLLLKGWKKPNGDTGEPCPGQSPTSKHVFIPCPDETKASTNPKEKT